MAGKIKAMIDHITLERSKGNPTLAVTTKTKILLKGVDPDLYTSTSPDDPLVIDKVKKIGEDFGIHFS